MFDHPHRGIAAVGDVDGVAARIYCHPPRSHAAELDPANISRLLGHGGGDGVLRAVDHRHRPAVAVGHVDGVGLRVYRHPHRPPPYVHGGGDGAGRAVDHRHRGVVFVGDVDGVGARV